MDVKTENSTTDIAPLHAGSFPGHIVPGSMFIYVSIYHSIHTYHQYFLARRQNVDYRAQHGRPYWFLHGKKPSLQSLEAWIKILLICIGVIGEVSTSYHTDLHGFTNVIMHAEHVTMFIAFGISAVVDLLSYSDRTRCCLPEGSGYLCGAGALFIELILFMYHLHGRTMLNAHIHTLLIYIIGLHTISTITECVCRKQVLWSILRPFFTWMQGTWFIQIAFTLFNPAHNSKPTLDVDDSESVMIVTLYFTGHILLAFAVQCSIGGVVFCCHGRPQPRSHEYLKLRDFSSGPPDVNNRNADDEETCRLMEYSVDTSNGIGD